MEQKTPDFLATPAVSYSIIEKPRKTNDDVFPTGSIVILLALLKAQKVLYMYVKKA
jgi:hypothetical protein